MIARRVRGSVAIAVLALALLAPGTAAAQSSYVALGASYSAVGNLLDPAPGSPPECLRARQSYPYLVAATLGLSLTDVACSNADTADLTSSQYPGVPPQFDALSPSTGIVSLEIGGNDHALLVSLIASCVAADVADAVNAGAPCQSVFGDHFAKLIAADAPAVAGALQAIHRLSPQAKVFVLGFPDVLPLSGDCYPQMPITTGDVAYLSGIERGLNQMIEDEAAANGATYVDTFTPTIGHDACQPEATRWIEPLVPGGTYAPGHPNVVGEAALARVVEQAIVSSSAGPAKSRRHRHHHHRHHHHRHPNKTAHSHGS